MLSSSRLARACTPRTCSQRSVAARAVFNTDEFSVPGAESVADQASSAAETAVDTVELLIEDVSTTASSRLSDAVGKVKEFSADVYANAVSSGTGADMPVLDFSAQFATYTEKASQMSAEMVSQSSVLADKVTAMMSEQLEALPEVQAQLAEQLSSLRSQAETALAGASDMSEDVSRQLTNEVFPRVSSEIDSFTQLAADGHYADAATSPAGIAAAGLSVLLLGSLAASASSSSSSSSKPAPSASPSPAENRVAADAWIRQWRDKNAPQQSPTATPAYLSSDSSSSSEDVADPAVAGASSNGAYASNGATASADRPAMDMGIAEYISGGESNDDSAGGGWYIASDSEAEDGPYSDVYTSGGNGSAATATEVAPEAVAEAAPAPTPTATVSDTEGATTDTASDIEPATTGTATLEAGTAFVEVRYHSGWEAPIIHACVAGGEWLEAVMERDPAADVFVWRGALDPTAVPFDSGAVTEFVITDGSGDWDKSPDGDNYRLFLPGAYDLSDGQLTSMQ
eukprot:jgi/Ulvmu1/3405/UM016_0022.1